MAVVMSTKKIELIFKQLVVVIKEILLQMMAFIMSTINSSL